MYPQTRSLRARLASFALPMAMAAATFACSIPAFAAGTYPDHAVEVVVPFPPGGIVDVVTRMMGKQLSKTLGQPVVVMNKPGAGGSIGAGLVAHSKPDGYTLLMAFDTHAINPLLYKLPFDSDKDLAPVSLVGTSALVLAVHPSVPAKDVPALVEWSKQHPDDLNYASTGAGSSNQLAAELFKLTTGAQLRHIPYKGGAPAITDLLAGRVQVMFVSTSSVLQYIRAGKLKALAVTTKAPIPQLPGVPSITDYYPGFEAGSWVGMLAPAGTPKDIIARLNREVHAAITSPEMQQFFEKQAIQPAPSTPEAFGELMHRDTQKWAKVIKQAGIKVE
ncbi:tripartite tricarboxylate transporter substrate binding protein [Candidimonas humi]|uniref:Bug family tripartite tricarboxylate transporter substrate binding protein n=1 Tax=Candidimonas humi TaxID=683355 RepID=A0ABV8P2H5_9BURK|nr:tripartite tricarboxylate transporter substrate binding protein [Candidimonas humi]MBV6306249.1 tripartite tricarboxylate transporter substrate binding protein [Candidimonas humi]